MSTKQKDFSAKARSIVGEATKPRSLGDFLDNDRNPDNTEYRTNNVRETVNTDSVTAGKKTGREEFRFDPLLVERLRRCAFETRRKKTTIVREALEKYLREQGF